MTTRSRTGRRALYSLLLLAVLATAPAARAQDPAAEAPAHVEEPGAEVDISEAPAVAQRLFRDIVCLCGGCKRETLEKCVCGYAKNERAKIMGMLAGKDISTDAAQDKAYIEVRDAIMKEYGGQHVLTVPLDVGFNRLAWIVPWAVFALALTLVVVVGRRWVTRGRAETAAARAGGAATMGMPRRHEPADEEREERLDDELRDID